MFRIIQGKGVIIPGCAVFSCTGEGAGTPEGTLLKRSVLLQPFHVKLNCLNCG